MQARSRATVERIYAASEALIAREGIGRLTIDAVAAEAKLSKGGVLHHFRSKEALVVGLAMRKLQKVQDGFKEQSAHLAGQVAPALRGMVEHAALTYGHDDGFSRALLVAAVENSASLTAFRAMFDGALEEVRHESADPDLATVLLLATVGLQVCQTLGFARLSPEHAEGAFASLRRAAANCGRKVPSETRPA